MSDKDNTYKFGMRLRVSRLVIGLISLALVLCVQFMVVAGVAGDHVYLDWRMDDPGSESSLPGSLKVALALLLVSGLALVTLGFESIIDKLPEG